MDTRKSIIGLRKRPDAVLFDWDNTLMDHDSFAEPVLHNLIQDLGKPPYPSVDEMNKLWGKNQAQCCERYFPGYTPEQVGHHFHTLSAALPIERAKLLPGALEVLDAFKAKGVPMAIVSNKPQAQLEREVNYLGLSDYFQVLHGDRGNHKLKPDPTMVMETLQHMKIMHGNSWFIGDMMADAGAARSDGFQRFLVGPRHRNKVQTGSYGADPAGKIIYLDSIALLKDFAVALPNASPMHTR